MRNQQFKSLKHLSLVLLSAVMLLCHQSDAQPNLSHSIEIKTRASANPANNFDTTYAYQCIITLQDTAGIEEIHFKMGTVLSLGDLISQNFEFDNNTNLPDGLDFHRRNYVVTLSLGNFKNRPYFIEVQLEDTSQVFSSTSHWNNL